MIGTTSNRMLPTTKEKLKLVLTILIVVAVGLFCVNQFLIYRNNATLLLYPCELCLRNNPNLTDCFFTREKSTIGFNLTLLNISAVP